MSIRHISYHTLRTGLSGEIIPVSQNTLEKYTSSIIFSLIVPNELCWGSNSLVMRTKNHWSSTGPSKPPGNDRSVGGLVTKIWQRGSPGQLLQWDKPPFKIFSQPNSFYCQMESIIDNCPINLSDYFSLILK